MLWEKAADLAAESLLYTMSWNYRVAWIGAWTLGVCLCRYFDLAPLRTLAVTIGMSFAAFMMFL